MKYGYGYVRVSTDKQDELSPDSQAKLLKEYAHKNNIVLIDIFYEIGVSGRKAEKRPQFQKMIALAKSKEHPVDVILVWKFSRFARNQEESIVYKSLLAKKHNVEVVSVSEPLVEGPFGSLIERIIEWMDEYYSVRLSGEVMRGMTEKAMRGGYQSRPPLGYKITEHGKPPVIVPEEAVIIRTIFNKYVHEKMGLFDIAKYLNMCGYLTSHKKPFERRSIEYILQNPTYCGKIRWNRTTNETNEIKSKDQWIIADGEHEPIISEELFEQAQARWDATYTPRGARPASTYKHWLSGTLKCPSCGRTMIAKQIKQKNALLPDYCTFVCYGYSKGKCLTNNSINSRILEPVVLQSIKDVLDSGEVTYTYIEPERFDSPSQDEALRTQLTSLEKKLLRIKEAYMNGVDSLEEYKDNKRLLELEKKTLVEQLALLEKTKPEDSREEKLLNKIQSVYTLLSDESIDIPTKNQLLKSVVEKIVYTKATDELKIQYFYKPA